MGDIWFEEWLFPRYLGYKRECRGLGPPVGRHDRKKKGSSKLDQKQEEMKHKRDSSAQTWVTAEFPIPESGTLRAMLGHTGFSPNR